MGAGIGLAAGLSPRVARAAELEIRVRVEQRTVEVGSPFSLEVEVKSDDRGRVQNPSDPIIQDLPGLRISFRSSGMNRSMAYRNGLMSSKTTRTFIYTVTALQPGVYPLKVGVDVGGEVSFAREVPTVTAQGAAVPVGAAAGSVQAGAASLPSARGQAPSSDRLQKEVFAQIVTNKRRAYVGEAITTQWEVWQRVTASISVDMLPVFKDFYAIELEAGEALEQFVGGRQWRVHPAVRRILFPQKSGTLEIGGGTLTVTPTAGFGLFSRPRGSAVTVRGEPVKIEVLPLPATGQPAGFSANNVGRYSLSVDVDRTEVEVGEALTATFTIAGDGNLNVLDPGQWPTPKGMRSYPPKEKFEQRVRNGEVYGVREFEVLYVADEVGSVVLPAKKIQFFDPGAAKYATSQSKPTRITVRPRSTKDVPSSDATSAAEVESPAAKGELGAGEDGGGELSSVLGQSALERGEVRSSWLTEVRWKRGMFAAPAIGLGALMFTAVARRIRPSESTLEGRRYRNRAKSLLTQARAGVDSGVDFESSLGALVQASAVRKAGDQAVGLERSRMLEALSAKGFPDADVALVGATLDACDAARYGAAARDPVDRGRLLADIERLLARWEVV